MAILIGRNTDGTMVKALNGKLGTCACCDDLCTPPTWGVTDIAYIYINEPLPVPIPPGETHVALAINAVQAWLDTNYHDGYSVSISGNNILTTELSGAANMQWIGVGSPTITIGNPTDVAGTSFGFFTNSIFSQNIKFIIDSPNDSKVLTFGNGLADFCQCDFEFGKTVTLSDGAPGGNSIVLPPTAATVGTNGESLTVNFTISGDYTGCNLNSLWIITTGAGGAGGAGNSDYVSSSAASGQNSFITINIKPFAATFNYCSIKSFLTIDDVTGTRGTDGANSSDLENGGAGGAGGGGSTVDVDIFNFAIVDSIAEYSYSYSGGAGGAGGIGGNASLSSTNQNRNTGAGGNGGSSNTIDVENTLTATRSIVTIDYDFTPMQGGAGGNGGNSIGDNGSDGGSGGIGGAGGGGNINNYYVMLDNSDNTIYGIVTSGSGGAGGASGDPSNISGYGAGGNGGSGNDFNFNEVLANLLTSSIHTVMTIKSTNAGAGASSGDGGRVGGGGQSTYPKSFFKINSNLQLTDQEYMDITHTVESGSGGNAGDAFNGIGKDGGATATYIDGVIDADYISGHHSYTAVSRTGSGGNSTLGNGGSVYIRDHFTDSNGFLADGGTVIRSQIPGAVGIGATPSQDGTINLDVVPL